MMSHIDSFKHMIVGDFIGIPVYFPLEDIDGDFKCTTKQLLIGGGSGEHPALVIKNPLAATAMFLDEEIDGLNLNEEQLKAWKSIYSQYMSWDYEEIIQFYEWNIETYHNFYERCKNDFLPNSYRIYEESKSIEEWLILGFGEFFFFSMPELVNEIVSGLDEPYKYFQHIRYNNILLIPPNMPVYANGGNAYMSRLETNITNKST